MKGKVIGALGLGLIGGLIAQAPVNKILPRVLPDSAGVNVYELSGTLFDGHAGYVQAQGVGADDVVWRLHPSSLLLGRVNADIEVSLDSRDLRKDNAWLSANVSRSLFSDRIVARDVQAAAPISGLQKPLKLPYLPVDAVIRLDLERIVVSGMAPQQIEGLAYVTQTQWKLGNAVSLGDYRIELTSDDDRLVARLSDNDAAKVAIQGEAGMTAERAYSVDLQLKPKLDTPTSVANQMKALGRTDGQGWYRLRQNGTF